jgi:hypothetical protein
LLRYTLSSIDQLIDFEASSEGTHLGLRCRSEIQSLTCYRDILSHEGEDCECVHSPLGVRLTLTKARTNGSGENGKQQID